jgi:hypothetical protein
LAEFFGAELRTGFMPSQQRIQELAQEFGVGVTYLQNLSQNLRFSPLRRLQGEASDTAQASALKTSAALADLDKRGDTVTRRRRLRASGGGRASAPGPLESGTSQQALLRNAQRRSILEDRR